LVEQLEMNGLNKEISRSHGVRRPFLNLWLNIIGLAKASSARNGSCLARAKRRFARAIPAERACTKIMLKKKIK
jgi:hypothetical protein